MHREPGIEKEPSLKQENVKMIWESLKKKEGISEISLLIKIEFGDSSQSLGAGYGLGGNIASEWDPENGVVRTYPEFYEQKDQKGILAHELGEMSIGAGIIDSEKAQAIIEEHNVPDNFESEWITELKEPDETTIQKEIERLKSAGQEMTYEEYRKEWQQHKLRQKICERFAAFLTSETPEEMMVKRIEKMSPTTQKQLREDKDALEHFTEETKVFFEYFQNSLKNTKSKLAISQAKPNFLGEICGFGAGNNIVEPAKVGRKNSLLQDFVDELEKIFIRIY